MKYRTHFQCQYPLPSILCYWSKTKCSHKTRDLLWFYDLPVLPWCHWGQEQKPEVLHRVRWYLEMPLVLLLNAVPFRSPHYLVDRDLCLTYAFINISAWSIKESHPCTRPLGCNSSVLYSTPQISPMAFNDAPMALLAFPLPTTPSHPSSLPCDSLQ